MQNKIQHSELVTLSTLRMITFTFLFLPNTPHQLYGLVWGFVEEGIGENSARCNAKRRIEREQRKKRSTLCWGDQLSTSLYCRYSTAHLIEGIDSFLAIHKPIEKLSATSSSINQHGRIDKQRNTFPTEKRQTAGLWRSRNINLLTVRQFKQLFVPTCSAFMDR